MSKLEKLVISGMLTFTGIATLGTVGVWTYLIAKYDK